VKRFVLSPEAERDIDEIKYYLVANAGVAVARYVIREIKLACGFLAATPNVRHIREDLTSEAVKFWPVFSYLIVYRPRSRPLEIVRVVHGRRDVEALLEPEE